MVRTAVAVGRIAVAWLDKLSLQFRGAGNGRLEVVHFKPQKHAISVREIWVADGTVMMLHIPTMQLENQPALRKESFILLAATSRTQMRGCGRIGLWI